MGQFIVIVGPTASGKTRLLEELLRLVPNSTRLVTTTSRSPRLGEREGVDYHFISKIAFGMGIVDGEFFEHALVHGNWYGSTFRAVRLALKKYATVITSVDVQGARDIKKMHPTVRTMFIRPDSLELIERRLRTEREGVSEAEICTRLETAKKELAAAETFDCVIDNVDGEFEKTIAQALAFVQESTEARA